MLILILMASSLFGIPQFTVPFHTGAPAVPIAGSTQTPIIVLIPDQVVSLQPGQPITVQ